MTFDEFFALVFDMRQAQIEYFKNRSQVNLQNAKRLEVAVDKALTHITEKGMQIPMWGVMWGVTKP